jgi:hypothetical protein
MADYDNTNRGVLFTNDRKQSDKHPDLKGTINIDGKEFWLSAWNKTGAKGPFISLSVEAKDAAKPQPAPAPEAKPATTSKPSASFTAMDDGLPF